MNSRHHENSSGRNSMAAAILATIAFTLAAQPMMAQTQGFLAGAILQAFDVKTGTLNGISLSPDPGGIPALSKDGSILYNPQISFETPSLDLLTTSGLQVAGAIPGMAPNGGGKAILDPTGTYAFVMGQGTETNNAVAVVNLPKQAVVAYIHASHGSLMDIALSPNGKQLFVSTLNEGGGSHAIPAPVPVSDVQQTVYECKAVPGICVFNTSPSFAAAGQVINVNGYLAVSQDGKSLYASGQFNFFWLINTTSLAVSKIPVTTGYLASAVAVAPSGNQAALLAGGASDSIFLLDTKTNEITGTLPSSTQLISYAGAGSSVMAFSTDGTSLWTISGTLNGVFPLQTLVGQSFPSGDVIAQTPLPPDSNAVAIVF